VILLAQYGSRARNGRRRFLCPLWLREARFVRKREGGLGRGRSFLGLADMLPAKYRSKEDGRRASLRSRGRCVACLPIRWWVSYAYPAPPRRPREIQGTPHQREAPSSIHGWQMATIVLLSDRPVALSGVETFLRVEEGSGIHHRFFRPR